MRPTGGSVGPGPEDRGGGPATRTVPDPLSFSPSSPSGSCATQTWVLCGEGGERGCRRRGPCSGRLRDVYRPTVESCKVFHVPTRASLSRHGPPSPSLLTHHVLRNFRHLRHTTTLPPIDNNNT